MQAEQMSCAGTAAKRAQVRPRRRSKLAELPLDVEPDASDALDLQVAMQVQQIVRLAADGLGRRSVIAEARKQLVYRVLELPPDRLGLQGEVRISA